MDRVSSITRTNGIKLAYVAPRIIQYGDVRKLTEKVAGSVDMANTMKMG